MDPAPIAAPHRIVSIRRRIGRCVPLGPAQEIAVQSPGFFPGGISISCGGDTLVAPRRFRRRYHLLFAILRATRLPLISRRRFEAPPRLGNVEIIRFDSVGLDYRETIAESRAPSFRSSLLFPASILELFGAPSAARQCQGTVLISRNLARNSARAFNRVAQSRDRSVYKNKEKCEREAAKPRQTV